MNERGKSDRPVVPAKPPNKAGRPAAEVVEGRGLAKGNADGATRPGPRAGVSVPSALDRVRRVARQDKEVRFTALLHHVTVDRLRAAYRALNPKAVVGVDAVTWQDYGCDLEANLQDLCARVHRGGYRAKPSRRVYIPKTDGRQRPLGIAALEDKIVQRAVVEVLNAIYETDFLGFSYGFRPGRSQHQALDALVVGIYRRRINWILDADIRSFFDSMSHAWLMRFLEHRIGDRRMLRLIGKWLKAGVLEEGRLLTVERGTPQGAVISPLLANIYLHYVYDLWVQRWRRRSAQGDVIVVRYADDMVVGFQYLADAHRFLAELKQRLEAFALEAHPDKTRIIEFGRFAHENRRARGQGKPETFAFLGFTHICGRTRQGRWLIRRHTVRDRLNAKLKQVKATLRRMMHLAIPEQGRYLRLVLNGFYNYYAVPTNFRALNAFYYHVLWHWLRCLRRRSQRHRLTWRKMMRIAERWLPSPKLRHPYPDWRFDVMTRGGSPVR
jgi:RNA-directed DNA polymerase